MSGHISEFFGFRAEDKSTKALEQAAKKRCPFLSDTCTKRLGRERQPSGACAVRQQSAGTPSIICCPIRLYAEDYRLLREIARDAFCMERNLYAGKLAVEKAKTEDGAIAVFGHGWGGELRLPKRQGVGSYFVDWVLARLDGKGRLAEFTAIEVQTVDTTGNYHESREALVRSRTIVKSSFGINWENVCKRIISQIIYKGQVLQREDLCKTGLYFVCPAPVYDRVLDRLGGVEKVPKFPAQPAAIHFVSYDYAKGEKPVDGHIAPLALDRSHCTTVYKVQEAFSSMSLPEGNVYQKAIERSLYG